MTETWKQWEGQSVNGKFRLRRYLGGSAHSAVFSTDYDDQEPQSAAIKLIPEDSPHAERQLDSWRLAATALSHPHLIQLFQAGRCKIDDVKLVYVVMERADEDLSQIIPQRPLTEAEATDVLKPALECLAHIHAKGSVHGRIKPANLMAYGDQLKLSSDGLRRAGDPIIGTAPYGPPEKAASPEGDVWSLAMTLVEALTQHAPAWDRTNPVDPVVPATLPGPLLDIARNCLRRDPKRRWTIAEIASRLDPTAVVLQLQPPQRVEPVHSPSRLSYIVPAALVLLLMIIVLTLKVHHREPKAQADPVAATEKSTATTFVQPQQPENIAASQKQGAINEEKSLDDTPSPPAPVQPTAPEKVAATAAAPADQDIVRRVIPEASQSALDTIRGTVRVAVRASVNPSGEVSDVTLDSPGPSKYFARLAQQAAQQWKFAPTPGATTDWILRFEFTTTGAKAFATPATP
jgi:TonB family protein